MGGGELALDFPEQRWLSQDGCRDAGRVDARRVDEDGITFLVTGYGKSFGFDSMKTATAPFGSPTPTGAKR